MDDKPSKSVIRRIYVPTHVRRPESVNIVAI